MRRCLGVRPGSVMEVVCACSGEPCPSKGSNNKHTFPLFFGILAVVEACLCVDCKWRWESRDLRKQGASSYVVAGPVVCTTHSPLRLRVDSDTVTVGCLPWTFGAKRPALACLESSVGRSPEQPTRLPCDRFCVRPFFCKRHCA